MLSPSKPVAPREGKSINASTIFKSHAVVSTAVAAAIVALGGLALDQGHIAAAPRGIVEIGALVPVEATPQVATLLPELVVSAPRLAMIERQPRA